jgi:lambda family phage minor tail protein L
MAVAAWAASTAFSVGDIRRATTEQASGLFFRCIQAGTSGSSEPSWPTDILRYDSSEGALYLFEVDNKYVTGGAVQDNTVIWAGIPSAYEELAKLNPSAIIELFELHLDNTLHGSTDVYRFHAGANAAIDGNVVFNGNTYTRIPVKADGFDFTNTGTLPRPTLTISNLDGTMTTLLLLVNVTTAGNDLGGAEVRRIRTLKKFLDGEATADPNAKFPDERWYVDRKANESRDSVTFELASKFDLAGQKLPKRQIVANVCQWVYRSSECSYTGSNYFDVNGNSVSTLAEDVCGKRVASCKLRFGDTAELPFGSFPGAGLTK